MAKFFSNFMETTNPQIQEASGNPKYKKCEEN